MRRKFFVLAFSFTLIFSGRNLFAENSEGTSIGEDTEKINVEEINVEKKSSAGNLGLSLGVFLKEQNGSQGEYVYVTNSDGEKKMLSELIWDGTPLFDFGLSFNASYADFSLGISASAGLPLPCGKMRDSDWMNNEDPGCDESLSSIKTHYTESSCSLSGSFSARLDFSYAFHPSKKFSIEPLLSVSYDFTSFSAFGLEGYYSKKLSDGTYGWWNNSSSNKKISVDGEQKTLTLQRQRLAFWTGFSLAFFSFEKWTFGAEASVCPFMFVESLDAHLRRNLQFYDLMHSFFKAGNAGLFVKFNAGRKIVISLGADFFWSGKIFGVSYTIEKDGSVYLGEGFSAADFWSLSFRCGFEYRFKSAS